MFRILSNFSFLLEINFTKCALYGKEDVQKIEGFRHFFIM